MDPTLVTLLAVGVAFAAVFALHATPIARRMLRDNGRLRLFEVLRGQGIAPPEPAGEASVRAAAYAVRRCVGCASQASCDRLAAARDWRALAEICPNQSYIDRLRAGAAVS